MWCRVDELIGKCGMMFDGLDTLLAYVSLSNLHLPNCLTLYIPHLQPLVAEVLSGALKQEAESALRKQVLHDTLLCRR